MACSKNKSGLLRRWLVARRPEQAVDLVIPQLALFNGVEHEAEPKESAADEEFVAPAIVVANATRRPPICYKSN
ncbi:hypothetical protein EMIT0194P_60178 [Pseudomonas serbica]